MTQQPTKMTEFLRARDLEPGDRISIERVAREVVRVDLTEPGVDDIVRKVTADAKSRDIVIGAEEIREQLERLYTIALEQVDADYPDPLGPNHGRVGD